MKCSLFSNDIQTIIPPPKHETAGKTGRLPGIFRHNERIVRVVDLRTKFGLSPSDPTQGRVIIADIDKGTYAFWVDKVINVIDQEDGRWDILPAALPREVFTSTFVMDKELILHTECARLEAMVPSTGLRQHIEKLEAQSQIQAPSPDPITPPTQVDKDEPAPSPLTTRTETPTPSSAATEAPKSTPARTATPPPAARPATARTTQVTAPARPATSVPSRNSTASTPAPVARTVPPAAPARPPVSPAPTVTNTFSKPYTGLGDRNTAVPPTPPQGRPASNKPLQAEEEEGSMIWLLLIVLLLFGAASGAILYVSGAFDSSVRKPPAVSHYEAPQPPAPVPVPTEVEPVYTPPPLAPSPEPMVMSELPAPEPAPTEPAEPEFTASIDRQERVLTITLDGPEDESVRPLLKEDDVAEPSAMDETASGAVTEATPAAGVEPEAPSGPAPVEEETPVQPRPRLQVTHVVVKGDTLWDIAERYVKDPLRYPELARLSGIKNPDRIYPGDIVRIIEK